MTAALLPAEKRVLCRAEDIPEGMSKAFPPAPGAFFGLFAIRQEGRILVYVNSCPHIGVPLNWSGDDFLTRDRAHIICATHGAEFLIATGRCFSGPCIGDHLEPIIAEIQNGLLLVPHEAGRAD
jgi:nitrite reductase/ring-hydroxylating ferredoxin subunit